MRFEWSYTGCQRRGKPAMCPPPRASRGIAPPLPLSCVPEPMMDSFELNKVLGAVLGTCLVLLALNIAAGAIFSPEKPSKPGYEIAVQEEPAEGSKGQEPAKQEPIEQLLASASLDRGVSAAKKCAACHTFDKGGPNRVGPNLWGVVGRPKASHGGFAYSDALKSKGGEWTINDLDAFIHSPKSYAPGTKMTFAGVSRGQERADLLTYLNSLSDSPAPLPKAAQAPEENANTPPAGGQPGSPAPKQ